MPLVEEICQVIFGLLRVTNAISTRYHLGRQIEGVRGTLHRDPARMVFANDRFHKVARQFRLIGRDYLLEKCERISRLM